MKELLKVVAKRFFIWSIIINTIYSIADYGEAFALAYFGTSPLTLNKIMNLTIAIFITYVVMLISGKIASYIDNVNEIKSKTEIEKYYFNKIQSMKMENTANTHTGYIHTLITEVSNNTGADYNLNEFNITVKDKDGNVMSNLKGYVGGTIPNGEKRTINTSSDLDLSKATSIEYSISK